MSDALSSGHPALRAFVSKQIAVRSSSHKVQFQGILIGLVYKQPVGSDVAFPATVIISAQGVVSVFLRQWTALRQRIHNFGEKVEIISSPCGCLQVPLESAGRNHFKRHAEPHQAVPETTSNSDTSQDAPAFPRFLPAPLWFPSSGYCF